MRLLLWFSNTIDLCKKCHFPTDDNYSKNVTINWMRNWFFRLCFESCINDNLIIVMEVTNCSVMDVLLALPFLEVHAAWFNTWETICRNPFFQAEETRSKEDKLLEKKWGSHCKRTSWINPLVCVMWHLYDHHQLLTFLKFYVAKQIIARYTKVSCCTGFWLTSF